ncbi:MAG: DNA polymerase III subunit gamma/tau [Planctomycetota bacterium]|nr:DNA polymerase III subunit gamma/tau [Planctomycetota bacterium]
MAYTVLARRYRSSTFDEIVGQEHIAQTLKKAIESGRVAHAYLFCGTRGTGKTSTARILAKALNCLSFDAATPTPCGMCDSCQAIARGDDMDVIEIDAASNTGVDNVREIIENSQYRPARSRFKIYIIDEVHMLSKSAFNALLKTLEEPPSHVKFILATTEPEKVLPTILSRCQRYDFRNISSREIAAHLKEICKSEKIKADDNALALIARAGAGSMRDALSLLDRLLSIGEKQLTIETIEQMLGMPRMQLIFDLAEAIGQGDVKNVLIQANGMINSGLSADGLIAVLIEHLRNLLIARMCGADSPLLDVPGLAPQDMATQANRFEPVTLSQDIAILEELRRNLRQNQTGRALLDATLVRLAMAAQFASIGQLLPQLAAEAANAPLIQKKKPEAIVEPAPAIDLPKPVEQPKPINTTPASDDEDDDDLPRPGKVWEGPSLAELARQQSRRPAEPSLPIAAANAPEPSVVALGDDDVVALWPRLIAFMQQKGSSLAGALSLASCVGITDGIAVIRFQREGETFARAWSSNGKKDTIAKALSELRGKPIGVRFEVDAEPAAAAPSAAAQSAPASAGQRSAPAVSQSNAVPSRPAREPAAAPVPTPARLSLEAIDELKSDPFVQVVLREFGGTIIKVD